LTILGQFNFAAKATKNATGQQSQNYAKILLK
jgi:hypothetical protein